MDSAGHGVAGEPRPIGATLRLLHLAWARRVHAGVAARFPDLSPAHLGVIAQCGHPPGGTRQTALAGRLGVTKQSLGETVDTLDALGYVERRPDPGDRRARLVFMTAKGRAAHDYAQEVADRIEADLRGTLGDGRYAELLLLLERLVEQGEA